MAVERLHYNGLNLTRSPARKELDGQGTERRRARDKVGEPMLKDEAFRRMFLGHGAVMLVVDLASLSIIDANASALRFYGYDRATMLAKRIPDLNITAEDGIRAETKRAVAEGRSYCVFQHRLASGEIRDVEVYADPISIDGKDYSLSIVHDITARRQAERELEEKEYLLLKSQDVARVGSYSYDIAGDWWTSTEVLDDIFGIDASFERTAAGWAKIVHPDERELMYSYLRRVIEEEIPFDREYRIVRAADGEVRWLHGRGELVRDAASRPVTLVGTIQDITERKQAERKVAERTEELSLANAELQRLVSLDGLTGIANRRLLDQRLEHAWADHRRRGAFLAVLIADLDYFKRFNDAKGHQQGDAALVAVADAMQSSLYRSTDFVARYGGEEFVAILPDTMAAEAESIGERIRLRVLSQEIEHGASDVSAFLTISVGVASMVPPRTKTYEPKILLGLADDALYEAKETGRNRVVAANSRKKTT